MKFLYAAYLITWSVIVVYILSMLVGFQKVSQEMRDLER
jgi:CcmD family protein